MAGRHLQKARKDAKRYLTKSGWSEDITMTSANGLKTITIQGWATKHWINFDTDGNAANTKNAHITVSEDELLKLGYPVRNSDNEIDLKNHKIIVKDSSGLHKKYVIIEHHTNETLGLISCILGDYE